MMNDIKTLLDEEIRTELKVLKGTPVDSDSFRTTVDELVKLIDRSIEMDKLETECDEKARAQRFDREIKELENELKRKQLISENIHKTIGHIVTVLGIAAPLTATVWGVVASFEFEKEGTITTIMGRGFLNKLIPNLKSKN